jgi:hypothetical protein
MSVKELYVVPDLIEIACTTNEVLCGSQDQNFNSPTFGGQDNDLIF